MSAEVYKELSRKMMFETSTMLPELWSMICSEEEADIVNALPGTAEELAERFGKDLDVMNEILQKLFVKGVVFENVRDGKTVYRMPRQIIQFHDASILWPDATEEFLNLWVRFMDDEASQFIKLLEGSNMPSFMRVIPINQTLEPQSQVLVYEDVARLIDQADPIAVVDCPCRKSVRKCDAPIETCIQLNRGAEYAMKRGTGRQLSREEAMELIRKTEEAGLVHVVENKGYGNVICNCCSCCCEMFRLVRASGQKWLMSPSRFLATVDADECTGCESCVDICPVDAIALNDEDVAEVSADECIGCGLCANECPSDAILLKEVRPENHIPM